MVQGVALELLYRLLFAIHLYKTSTPSTRNGAVDSQVKSNPRNNLIYGQHRCGKGRNARGIITAGHRGGGHKRLYRKIDFRRNEKRGPPVKYNQAFRFVFQPYVLYNYALV
ncbi:hypothetical protein Patl1_26045 [Pistacia atlantica]|uniref:Uncharacterized protein n=1 Tax=Pistacia atlantica TaxID=434234 RepID=A0ACC1AZ14_9ROSI|nr:hypothetical protein Patl1_26045 [Pistacia atlantica]